MDHEVRIPDGFDEALKAMILAKEQGNFEQTEAAMLSIFSIVQREVMNDRSPEMLARIRAEEFLANHDYAGAEAAYREVLALKEAKNVGDACLNAHMDLCLFLLLMRRPEEALAQAEISLKVAKHSEFDMVRWMGLDRWLRCAIAAGKTDGLLEPATAALEIVAAALPGETPWGCALLRRAQCKVAAGDPWGAEMDLDECREVLVDSKQGTLLPGLLRYMALWWETRARCASLQGMDLQAILPWSKAVELRRALLANQGDLDVHDSDALARTLKQFSKALALVDRDVAAAEMESEAMAIWSRLALSVP